MSAAHAHGAVTVEAGEVDARSLVTWHPDGTLSVRVTEHPVQVWIWGTPEAIEEFLVDVGCVVTAAVADRQVPA